MAYSSTGQGYGSLQHEDTPRTVTHSFYNGKETSRTKVNFSLSHATPRVFNAERTKGKKALEPQGSLAAANEMKI